MPLVTTLGGQIIASTVRWLFFSASAQPHRSSVAVLRTIKNGEIATSVRAQPVPVMERKTTLERYDSRWSELSLRIDLITTADKADLTTLARQRLKIAGPDESPLARC
jgi:hypothetical protein